MLSWLPEWIFLPIDSVAKRQRASEKMIRWGVICISLLVAVSKLSYVSPSISDAIIASSVVESKFLFLGEDVRTMLKQSISHEKRIAINEPCETTFFVCIYF